MKHKKILFGLFIAAVILLVALNWKTVKTWFGFKPKPTSNPNPYPAPGKTGTGTGTTTNQPGTGKAGEIAVAAVDDLKLRSGAGTDKAILYSSKQGENLGVFTGNRQAGVNGFDWIELKGYGSLGTVWVAEKELSTKKYFVNYIQATGQPAKQVTESVDTLAKMVFDIDKWELPWSKDYDGAAFEKLSSLDDETLKMVDKVFFDTYKTNMYQYIEKNGDKNTFDTPNSSKPEIMNRLKNLGLA